MIFCRLGIELDKRFIKKLLETNDVLIRNEFGLNEAMFLKETKETFSFIYKYYEENGKFPSISGVKEVTSLDLSEESTELDLKDYAKAIVERDQLKQIDNSIPSLIQFSQEAKIEDLKTKLNEMIFNLNEYLRDTDSMIDMRHQSEKRFDLYEKRASGEVKIMGLPTPWPELDEVTLGLRDGDYWVAVAKPEVGKSWLSILFADRIWRSDNKVLYISLEMPVYQIINRWDAIHAGISASGLERGKLITFPSDRDQTKMYLSALKGMHHLPECIVVGNGYVRNLMDIKVLINYYKPQALIIDAMYNLEMGFGYYKDKYYELREVSKHLQSTINKNKLKFVGTTQFQRNGESLEDLGYTKGFAEDASLVLGMYKDEDDDLNYERYFEILKARHAERKVSFKTKFDLYNMDFRFIGFDD